MRFTSIILVIGLVSLGGLGGYLLRQVTLSAPQSEADVDDEGATAEERLRALEARVGKLQQRAFVANVPTSPAQAAQPAVSAAPDQQADPAPVAEPAAVADTEAQARANARQRAQALEQQFRSQATDGGWAGSFRKRLMDLPPASSPGWFGGGIQNFRVYKK